MNPCFAVIDANTLSRTSLRNLLWDVYNQVEIFVYGSMEEFIHDSNRHFVHFFVSSEILFSHVDEFETLKEQTSVLSVGGNGKFEAAGFHVLDISRPEKEIAGRLLQIQIGRQLMESKAAEAQKGAGAQKGDGTQKAGKRMKEGLSVREKDVLELMVKGFINKEIADRLGISTTTVIFHRNNICDKLGTRSIGRLTIYAVLGGIIDINEI